MNERHGIINRPAQGETVAVLIEVNGSFGRPEVTDMTLIEIDRLLNCTVDELIALVQPMSADNCERYARAILGQIGGPSFEQVMMRIVETAAPKDGDRPPRNSDAYYFAVCDLFPHVKRDNDVVGRLVFLATYMATLRLEKHDILSTH
jgi:hypothetical protein